MVGEKEGRADRSKEGRKEGRKDGEERDLALCIRRRAIARPLFSRLPVRSATISSYYRNIRFNGERQGITMRDTTPPLPRDETRHFPSGNLFFFPFFLSLSLARSLERASGVNSARVMFPFQRCSMYVWVCGG